MTMSSTRRRGERGQTLVLLGLMSTVIFGVGSLALDTAMTMADRRDVQAAADAAALAAAQSRGTDSEHYVAMQYLSRDLGFAMSGVSGCTGSAVGLCPAGTYNVGDYSITFADSTGMLDVDISHNRSTLLGGVIGFAHISSGAGVRVSVLGPQVGADCVLCILDPHAPNALTGTGNATFTINNGGVAVNSDSTTAATLTGNATATAHGGAIAIDGGWSSGKGGFSPTPTQLGTQIQDPLASLPYPSLGGTTQSVNYSGATPTTINPGIYSTITLAGQGNLVMNPGVYVVTGSLNLSGQGSIVATGVTIFLACANYPTPCSSGGQAGASVSISGNGSFLGTAPTSGTYQGVLLFADRNNTATISVTGNGAGQEPTGTIYAPAAQVSINGNGGALNSVILAGTVAVTGNGNITLNYNASQQPQSTGSKTLIR